MNNTFQRREAAKKLLTICMILMAASPVFAQGGPSVNFGVKRW